MEQLTAWLAQNPLLLLFFVVGLGYLIGRMQILGVRMGLAAVLFTGLACGAVSKEFELPEIIYQFGLVIFVYALGINSGPTVIPSLRGAGLKANAMIAIAILIAASLAFFLARLFSLEAVRSSGMFTGALTSTPALAALLDFIKHGAVSGVSAAVNEPVVGYSLAYPGGVLGMMLVIVIAQRWWKVDYTADAKLATDIAPPQRNLDSATFTVTQSRGYGMTLNEIAKKFGDVISFGRYKRGDDIGLALDTHRIAEGDIYTVVGPHEQVTAAIDFLGVRSTDCIELCRSEIDYRRIFVTNPKIAGKRLKEINLPQRFGAVVTRVRRGDVEFVPTGSTILQPGDRVRVVTRHENIKAVSEYFGDSYKVSSEIDFVTVGIGVAIGLLVGLVQIPLPGGASFQLGIAGGPLIVALILGAMRRTGPIVWVMPYSASQMLNQVGLALFFAGVGLRAGHRFVVALADGSGWIFIIAGFVMTTVTTTVALVGCYRFLRMPFAKTMGILAGMQTQPAVLEFANEQAKNDLPKIGYSLVYPVATIVKISAAQLLLILMAAQ